MIFIYHSLKDFFLKYKIVFFLNFPTFVTLFSIIADWNDFLFPKFKLVVDLNSYQALEENKNKKNTPSDFADFFLFCNILFLFRNYFKLFITLCIWLEKKFFFWKQNKIKEVDRDLNSD